MTEPQTYIFHDKAFYFYVVNDKPWFRAKDVAAVLEYNDTNKAIANNVDNDDKRRI